MLKLLAAFCGLLGLAIGSFLNVVIYRVPRQLSIVRPGSACPSCGAPIALRDNIPVLSWLMLQRRCRICQASIAWRYPLVELGTGLLFAGSVLRLGANLALPAYLALFAGLVVLAWIDVVHLVLPSEIVYPLLAFVSVSLLIDAAAAGSWHRLFVAVICSLSWFGLFFVMNLASSRILGFGDVRLAPILGLALGWLGVGYVLVGFFLANLIGAIVGVTLIATKRMKRDQPIPYGVFLAIGTALAIFAGPVLLAPFAHLSVR